MVLFITESPILLIQWAAEVVQAIQQDCVSERKCYLFFITLIILTLSVLHLSDDIT